MAVQRPRQRHAPARTRKLSSIGAASFGAEGSKIVFNVVIKNGKYSKIKDARFRRVPISCDGDSPIEFVHGHFLGIRTNGRRFRYRGGFGSATFRDSEMLFYGEIRSGGASAKGKLRWRFVDHTGNRCNTGLQRWKTHVRAS